MDSESERILADNFPALFAELTWLRPLLETQGVIQRHRDGYRLRYRFFDSDAGFTRHRSLALPSEFVIDHVRAILCVWREQRQAADAVEEQRLEEVRKQKHVLAIERQVVQSIVGVQGGGPRRKRRAAEQFDAAVEAGPLEMLRFSLFGNFGQGGKPGRPRKQRMFYAGWDV